MVNPTLKPVGRTLAEFEPLKPAEQKLLEACQVGTMGYISEQRPEQADDNNTVRASFLRFLALGGDKHAPVHEKGVPLYGAWVEDDLDLESSTLLHNLALSNCQLSTVILRNCTVHGFVSFHGCHVKDLNAERMVCTKSVFLKDGFIATGTVCLQGAEIGCDLICDKGEVRGKDDNGNALVCDGAVIKGNVLLRNGFTANGSVRFIGAQIGGSMVCTDVVFLELRPDDQYDDALVCDRAVIKGGVSLNGSFKGTVRFSDTQMGFLICDNGIFDGMGKNALLCDGAVIKGNVFFRDDFTANGTVRFLGAHIGGALACENASFDGKGSDALICENAIIKGSVFLAGDFIATGMVRLRSVQIGSSLICKGKFDGKGGDALLCDGAVVKGGVFLNGGFTAIGAVRLLEAQIGGSLECRNAKFKVQTVTAQIDSPLNSDVVVKDVRHGEQYDGSLVCDRAVINGSVFLVSGFAATGTVRLLGVQIAGDLECSNGATLNGVNGIALYADGMTVADAFHFRNLSLVKGIVSLSAVKVGSLIDDDQSWHEGELNLDGFIYDRLAGNAPTDAKSRLAWLDKQSASDIGKSRNANGFKPQPWRQLQKVLREMGHVEDERQVAIAFEDRLRTSNLIGQTPENWRKPTAWLYRKISRGFHCLFGWLIRIWLSPVTSVLYYASCLDVLRGLLLVRGTLWQ